MRRASRRVRAVRASRVEEVRGARVRTAAGAIVRVVRPGMQLAGTAMVDRVAADGQVVDRVVDAAGVRGAGDRGAVEVEEEVARADHWKTSHPSDV